MIASDRLGVVVIGRNEGDRLVRCIESVISQSGWVVYVDSGSTDDSISQAQRLGAAVVSLPSNEAFTAARARNAGLEALHRNYPGADFVQFVDGDCAVASQWLEAGRDYLDAHPGHAIVCGYRKEREPNATIYNRLCDLEWRGPTGDIAACGGDFMARAAALVQVGGFNPQLIAGEEPELCHRLRRAGYSIHRLDAHMTYHDAAMHRIGQWVRRTSRAGYAYAARAALHWRDGTRFCWRENARIVAWAALLPLLAVVLAITLSPWWLLLLLSYPLQVVRQWRRLKSEQPAQPAGAAAVFTVLGKWPEFYGQMLFLAGVLTGREQRLIEYK